MDDTLRQAVAHFNAGRYRDALLAFERRWHGERSDELRALINLCNALNQLRLGLLSGPRANLATAETLLAGAGPVYEAIDLAAVRAYVSALRAALADAPDADTTAPWETLPRPRL